MPPSTSSPHHEAKYVIFFTADFNCPSVAICFNNYASFNLGMCPNNIMLHFIPGGCHSISITKMQELAKAVAEIGEWEILCEYLGVPKAVLSDLRSMINTENRVKKHRCLEAYINTDKACWETVVEVVANSFHNARVANEIARDHIHGVGYPKDEL